MFGCRELDAKNIYKPDLQDIHESAERTYGQAIQFFEMVEKFIENLDISKIPEKEIYDKSNVIATQLALCCELFLKAIYIYENNTPGSSIEEIWTKLKKSDFKTDKNGNIVYKLEYKTGASVLVYVKCDENGDKQYDENGKLLYVDENGNIYKEGQQGKKIKVSGHELDRLIELLSPSSRLLLETRLLTIPMEKTELNDSISVLDLLKEKGIITSEEQISHDEYIGWLELHKKTFEQARYAGQEKHEVNVEFLYHLATQIKAVAQFKLDPKNNQRFTITDEQLQKLPMEIKQIVDLDEGLLSEKLIKLITSDDTIRNKLMEILSKNYLVYLKGLNSNTFCDMLECFDNSEILYTVFLCYLYSNYEMVYDGKNDYEKSVDINSALLVIKCVKKFELDNNQLVYLCLQMKKMFKRKLSIQFLAKLFKELAFRSSVNINKSEKDKINNLYYLDNSNLYLDLKY